LANGPQATLPKRAPWADLSDDDSVAITDAPSRQRKSAAQRRVEKRDTANAKKVEKWMTLHGLHGPWWSLAEPAKCVGVWDPEYEQYLYNQYMDALEGT